MSASDVLAGPTGYPLLNIFWTILWLFLWIAWIFLLFRIIGDVFRSRDLSGGAKAVWVIVLIAFPLIGGVAYLLARGSGMHERDAQQAAAVDEAVRAYVRSAAGPAAGGVSMADELTKLADLHARGVLDDQEFAAQKARLLG